MGEDNWTGGDALTVRVGPNSKCGPNTKYIHFSKFFEYRIPNYSFFEIERILNTE